MGPYCDFCDRRCFVLRVRPEGVDGPAAWTGVLLMATCQAGAAHDRAKTGHDYTTAINPYDERKD